MATRRLVPVTPPDPVDENKAWARRQRLALREKDKAQKRWRILRRVILALVLLDATLLASIWAGALYGMSGAEDHVDRGGIAALIIIFSVLALIMAAAGTAKMVIDSIKAYGAYEQATENYEDAVADDD